MNNAAFKGQLGIGERCIDATLNSVRLIFCPEGNNRFQYTYNTVYNTYFQIT